MDLAHILKMFLGLSLFLYGMNLMGAALERRAGKQLKMILSKLAANPFKGFLLGTAVTAIVQSSCATTVMVVGFVNSGIMDLYQSVGIILGANVGTSATAWLLSLSNIQGTSVITSIFSTSTFVPILAVIGIVMLMFAKKERKKDTAGILLGFSVLMFGMSTMSDAVKPLSEMKAFTDLLTMFSNPFLGLIVGTLFTAVIQSSSASTGIIQALSMTGAIRMSTVFPLLFGFNIGTCITAIISSSGASADAKRASMIHLIFNVLCTVIGMPLFYLVDHFAHFAFLDAVANPVSIAILHSTIKIICSLIALPFPNQFIRLSRLIVRGKKEAENELVLDERLFVTPAIAIDRARSATIDMAQTAAESYMRAISLLDHFSEEGAEKVSEYEDLGDKYEDVLGTFLVKLGEQQLTADDSHEQTELLHMIGDLERITDHADNLAESARELFEKKLHFSDEALEELTILAGAVGEAVRLSMDAFIGDDLHSAARVEPLEQVVDSLQKQVRARHIDRLTRGVCSIEHGFVLNDILANLERISDHCSNIAGCVIETHLRSMDMHSYLGEVKSGSDKDFNDMFDSFTDKYALPVRD